MHNVIGANMGKDYKTIRIDKETHILLKKTQAIVYEIKKTNYDIDEIIQYLVANPERAAKFIADSKIQLLLSDDKFEKIEEIK